MSTATAPGKIILSGEYAVLFGYPGIAIPAPLSVTVHFEQNASLGDIVLDWKGPKNWQSYGEKIINLCIAQCNIPPGTLTIQNQIPLGKGMGASTAFVIAIARCLLGKDCMEQALATEDALNPGHSGIDFAVIWNNAPVQFKKDTDPEPIELPKDILANALLIDTGTPNETTPQLIAWIKNRNHVSILENIGKCTNRLVKGETLASVLHDHHRQQCILGIVNKKTEALIKRIETSGGAAKVIGAGGRSGGNGMVLAINTDPASLPDDLPLLSLTP